MTTEANVRLKIGADASEGLREIEKFSSGSAVKFGLIATVASKAFDSILSVVKNSFREMVVGGAEFEQKIKSVWAVTGEGKDVLSSLEKTARDMGKSTVVSATEAADAMLIYARAGFQANDITNLMKASIDASIATSTDLSIITDTVTNVINQFGKETSEASNILDVLTMTANKSAVDINQLQQSLIYAGSIGKAFGLSFEEVNAILGELGNVGHRGSIAGTELARALVELSTPTDRQADVLSKYNITLEDVNAETHKITDTLELFAQKGVSASDVMVIFGQEAGKGMTALIEGIRSGKVDFDGFIENLKNAKGTVTGLSKEMSDTVTVKYKIFTSALSELALNVYGKIKEPLKALLETSTEMVDKVNKIVEGSNEKVKVSTFSPWEYIKNASLAGWNFLAKSIYNILYVPIEAVFKKIYSLAKEYGGLIIDVWSASFDVLKAIVPGLVSFIEKQKKLGMTSIDLTTANDNLLSSQNEVLASYDEALGLMSMYDEKIQQTQQDQKDHNDETEKSAKGLNALSDEYKKLSLSVDDANQNLLSTIDIQKMSSQEESKLGKRSFVAPSELVQKTVFPEKTIFPTETFDDRASILDTMNISDKIMNFVIEGFKGGVSILSGKADLFSELSKGLSSSVSFALDETLGRFFPKLSGMIGSVITSAMALPTAIGGELFGQLLSVGGNTEGRKQKLADVTEQIASLVEKKGISSDDQKKEIDARLAELKLQQAELQKSNAEILHDQFEMTKKKWLGMFDNLIQFMPMLVDAFEDILTEVMKKLPDVIKSLADSVDDILLTIASNFDEIIVALASAMPYVALALAKAMPIVALGLVTAVVDMLDNMLGKIPGMGDLLDSSVNWLTKQQNALAKTLVDETEMPKRHSGGFVHGGDNVPMMLQGGEFVLSRKAVSSMGAQNVTAINEGRQNSSNATSISITINAIDAKGVSDFMRKDFVPEFIQMLNNNNKVNGTTLKRELRFAVNGL